MGVHALRHTFATRAIESGMDVRTLSEILGHTKVALTLQLYAHSSMEPVIINIHAVDESVNDLFLIFQIIGIAVLEPADPRHDLFLGEPGLLQRKAMESLEIFL
nr:tyrosine-type recombinase/integrase [Clostridia bacterium]